MYRLSASVFVLLYWLMTAEVGIGTGAVEAGGRLKIVGGYIGSGCAVAKQQHPLQMLYTCGKLKIVGGCVWLASCCCHRYEESVADAVA